MKELINKLRQETGCGLIDCKKAIDYSSNNYLLAIAYLKAKTFAVNTPNLTFDERVQMFYDNMDRLNYLKKRYETEDLEILKCRVPFNFEDSIYNSLSDEEYISMIDNIETGENEAIYAILKDRGIIK